MGGSRCGVPPGARAKPLDSEALPSCGAASDELCDSDGGGLLGDVVRDMPGKYEYGSGLGGSWPAGVYCAVPHLCSRALLGAAGMLCGKHARAVGVATQNILRAQPLAAHRCACWPRAPRKCQDGFPGSLPRCKDASRPAQSGAAIASPVSVKLQWDKASAPSRVKSEVPLASSSHDASAAVHLLHTPACVAWHSELHYSGTSMARLCDAWHNTTKVQHKRRRPAFKKVDT